jgi:hypothetical protein
MSLDLGPRQTPDPERPLQEEAGPVIPGEAARQADLPVAKTEEIQIDQEVLVAVEGLLSRLDGRVRGWHVMYELYGTCNVDPTVAKDLTEKLQNLGRAGLVVNVARDVYVPPDSRAARQHARKKEGQRRAKAKQARIRQDIPNSPVLNRTKTPKRQPKQTPADLEEMIRQGLGGSRRHAASRSTAKGRRRHSS